ncbi:hypothetical protein GIB67_011178 [Kingdonia uniflora]|uniref:TF-B3 domain-containing protein n=1 Tax=Kingdonia uniflora TaxID=39325 RepID=A0A7J7ND46_9MAGN|nr:hypothetical protein GIB67_011178 [Kingdonia uniflora]
MGKTPVRMKAVVYALSPFQQKVMPGLWKDLSGKIHHKITENWISATLLLAPVIGTYRSELLTMAMADNAYEEARKKRLEDNKKRFEDLGITKISEKLAEIAKSEKKTVQRQVKPRTKFEVEPRRSSRERNPITSYAEEVYFPSLRKRSRSRSGSSWTSYIARPLDEVRVASYKERVNASEYASDFQRSLPSGNPSFVKSMVRSHVYSCFWLGLPKKFCDEYLPLGEIKIVLEDENGSECDTVYIGSRTGLSGGWRGFALDHKLDDGDALVFEQTEPTRFKVYIFKACNSDSKRNKKVRESNQNVKQGSKKVATSKKPKKFDSTDDEFTSWDSNSESDTDEKDDVSISQIIQQDETSAMVAKDVSPEPLMVVGSKRFTRSASAKLSKKKSL